MHTAPIKTGTTILKPSYLLLIDNKEFPLYAYEVSYSVFTPGGVCICETDYAELKEGTPLELKLGYENHLWRVFKGYVETTFRNGNRLVIRARNEHFWFLRQRVSGCLKDVTPKEVLSFLTPKGFVLANRPYDVRHHFLIWNLTKDEVLKEVLKAWNLKTFTYWWDLEGILHLHPPGEEVFEPTEVPQNFILKTETNRAVLNLSPWVFVNQTLNPFGRVVATVKHLWKGKRRTLVEFLVQ